MPDRRLQRDRATLHPERALDLLVPEMPEVRICCAGIADAVMSEAKQPGRGGLAGLLRRFCLRTLRKGDQCIPRREEETRSLFWGARHR